MIELKDLSNEEILAKKGNVLTDGKTKILYDVIGYPDFCIITSKNAITKFDDPKETKEFQTKGIASTVVTSIMFTLLNEAGIETSFVKQLSNSEFLAKKTIMIPLEVVARRYAVGSYLKREPFFVTPDGKLPMEFDDLCIEFFLKTTEGACEYNGQVLSGGLIVEDPFIVNPYKEIWHLVHPKKPYDDEHSFLATFNSNLLLTEVVTIEKMEEKTCVIFEILEKVWKEVVKWLLVDFKIEFGITSDGRVVVSDVIDNDSWRILDENFEDLSKQAFRDDEPLSEVEKKYLRVMEKAKELLICSRVKHILK